MKLAVKNIHGPQSTLQLKRRHYYKVPNDYNFSGNSATDVTTFENVEMAFDSLLFSYTEYKDYLDTYAQENEFSAQTQEVKLVLANNFSVEKADRDSVISGERQVEAAILMQQNKSDAEELSTYKTSAIVISATTGTTTTESVPNDISVDSVSATTYYGSGLRMNDVGNNIKLLNMTLGGIYSTSSTSFSQLPENLTLPSANDSFSGSTSIKCKVLVSYNIIGASAAGEVELWDYTDSLAITGSTTSLPYTGVWSSVTTPEVTLTEGKTYRIRTRRVGGTGGNSVQVEGSVFILKFE